MRVYVAGPVTGRPRRNLAMFEHAAKQLVQAGHLLAMRLDMDVRELSRWTG